MKILFIDSYDSFTFNLTDLFRKAIPDSIIHVIHNDEHEAADINSLVACFDAVVIGPGPGSPSDPKDVGIIPSIWKLPPSHILPVFGVCLGHQSLCLHLGGTLKRLPLVKHGQLSSLEHSGHDIFNNIEDQLSVVRYHSLYVDIGLSLDEIVPLAWATDVDDDGVESRILMAACHVSKPFWGVQYHPESICTDTRVGVDVIQNFGRLAKEWNIAHGRTSLPDLPKNWRQTSLPNAGLPDDLAPLPLYQLHASNPTDTQPSYALKHSSISYNGNPSIPVLCEMLTGFHRSTPGDEFVLLDSSAKPGRFSIIGLISDTTTRISYNVENKHLLIRNPGAHHNETVDLGKDGHSVWEWVAQYMHTRKVTQGGHDDSPFWGGLVGYINYEASASSLAGVTLPPRGDKSVAGRPDVNFAFIERSVVVDRVEKRLFVQELCSSSTRDADSSQASETSWLDRTTSFLQLITSEGFTPASSSPPSPEPSSEASSLHSTRSSEFQGSTLKVTIPDKDQYILNILRAKEYLDAGESYELCQTALTRIDLPLRVTAGQEPTAWRLFKSLRAMNPAPYGSYIRLGGTTLVGSSPERFLSWTRDGLCQMRPIKGTIKRKAKTIGPDGDEMEVEVSFEEAERRLLGSAKEIAENLMIVDLIRHDLHRVISTPFFSSATTSPSNDTQECGRTAKGDVNVTQLFKVETYETVYQLVSVVEGQLDLDLGYTGWDVLSRSLPPGSMTGAPKKRSVQLLQTLETLPVSSSPPSSRSSSDEAYDAKASPRESFVPAERGVYSGVCGYWCVGGSGDFSVIIRSAFRYDDETTKADSSPENPSTGRETWYLGAGGAITALSDPEEEWEEMYTKLQSTLRAFEHL